MFTAFALIFLYLAAIIPALRLGLYFISGIFTAGLTVEKRPGWAMIMFAATSGLGLLIVPNFLLMIPYICLFGHYAIGKYIFERTRNKAISFIMKLLYFNAGLALIYFFAWDFFGQGVLADFPFFLLIILAQAAFIVYDFIFSKVIAFYVTSVRKALLKR